MELLGAECLETDRLAGRGVRGGAGVEVAVTSGWTSSDAPQDEQNLLPESISRPHEEQ